jgi:TPP-dependent pyruvate/acetoin dehydrogenase alpha subunit
MVRDVKDEMEDAVEFGKKSPFPDENLLLEHVYAP